MYQGPEVTDQEIEGLFDPKRFDKSRKEADQKFKGMSKEVLHSLRARCKRDLFYLTHTVLGYGRLSPNLHGHVCKHITDTADERFRIYLLPRNHFKTRILTIGFVTQTVLPYDAEDAAYDYEYRNGILTLNTKPLSHPAQLGPNARVLIAHESHQGAARYLYSITAQFTGNPMFMGLFPELVPNNRKQRINKWELELPRAGIYDEPTIDTIGVGARSQGRHYNLIDLDDIYGIEARDSEAVDLATKDWFDNIQAFFAVFMEDKWIMPGTRYRFDDVYNHAMENYEGEVKVYKRSVEERNLKTGVMEPIFPEEVTSKSLAILKKNTKVYDSQYLNDPALSGAGFNLEDERLFYWKTQNTLVAFDGKVSPVINIRDMDIVILIDPGKVTGGFIVTGTDSAFRIFTLVALPLSMPAPELVELLFRSVIRWQPRTVGFETDALQDVYVHWLVREMSLRGVRFHITPCKTRQRAADDRINGLSNYFAAHRIFFNEKQEEMRREYRQWKKSKKIHLLDALAYGPELWRPGWLPGQRREMFEQNEEIDEGRDTQTGYSAQ